jgi:hypothetical protein
MLSSEAFRCPGIQIVRGRAFTQEEGLPKGPPAVVISEALWSRRFATDPAILGKSVAVNGAPRTVAGIAAGAPAMLEFGTNPQIYLPAQFVSEQPRSLQRRPHFFRGASEAWNHAGAG